MATIEQASEFDERVERTLTDLYQVVEAETDKFPLEEYPTRGAALRWLGLRLGETVEIATRLHEFPPDTTDAPGPNGGHGTAT